MNPACMGGWCSVRSRCERYTTDDRREPAERLCEPGEEGQYRLISRRSVGEWERAEIGLPRAEPFDAFAVIG